MYQEHRMILLKRDFGENNIDSIIGFEKITLVIQQQIEYNNTATATDSPLPSLTIHSMGSALNSGTSPTTVNLYKLKYYQSISLEPSLPQSRSLTTDNKSSGVDGLLDGNRLPKGTLKLQPGEKENHFLQCRPSHSSFQDLSFPWLFGPFYMSFRQKWLVFQRK